MRTFLYLVWFAIPSIFLFLALYSQLEVWSGKGRKGESATSLKQGLFVLSCSLVSYFIDQYYLEDLVNSFLDPFVPLILAQIILFPIILLLGAQLVGGTKPLHIKSKRPAPRRKK